MSLKNVAAMILSAGFGTRLGALCEKAPKPMLKLGELPILEHTIRHLKLCGVENIVLNLHYLPDVITSYFGDGSKFGVNITYSYEESPLGTAGAVKKVEDVLSRYENFLVIYGDIVSDMDYKAFFEAHRSKKALGTIVLHKRKKSNSFVFMDEDNKISKFIERPTEEVIKQEQIDIKAENFINSGIYCFKREVLKQIPAGSSDFPKDMFPSFVKSGSLYGYELDAYRCAVDSVERYNMLQLDYQKGQIFNYGEFSGLEK